MTAILTTLVPKGRSRTLNAFAGVVVLSGLLILGGCAVANIKADEHFERKQVEQIEPGRTTKAEVVRLLGIPIAVAQPGETVVYPTPDIRKIGSVEKPGDVFMDIFTPEHKIRPDHRVYYYYSVELRASSYFAGVNVTNRRLVIDELWILIDNATGRVVDYIYEDRE